MDTIIYTSVIMYSLSSCFVVFWTRLLLLLLLLRLILLSAGNEWPTAKNFILVRDGWRWFLSEPIASLEDDAFGQVCSISSVVVLRLSSSSSSSFVLSTTHAIVAVASL